MATEYASQNGRIPGPNSRVLRVTPEGGWRYVTREQDANTAAARLSRVAKLGDAAQQLAADHLLEQMGAGRHELAPWSRDLADRIESGQSRGPNTPATPQEQSDTIVVPVHYDHYDTVPFRRVA